MNTKLTLRLDKELINKAKNYAKKEGKSLSQLVADFFSAINSKKAESEKPVLMPKTSRLYKSLKGKSISEEDYNKYLREKYL